MPIKPFRIGILFSLLCLFLSVHGQSVVINSLVERMHLYSLKKPPVTLFVHFDKNVYTNSEAVWFTGYLLKSTGKTVHHTLSVSLVRSPDRSIVLTRQFVMSGGISKGNLQLPDDLLPGSYAFIAFTNVLRNGKPEDVFIQPLTIKGVTEPPFSASLKLVDTA